MKTHFLALMAVVLLTGCFRPSTKPATTHYDSVTGRRTDLMESNLLEGKSDEPPREVVWLNAMRDFRASGDVNYYLEVVYMARMDAGYLDIPAGSSLELVADGHPVRFSGGGSGSLRSIKDGLVHEQALYHVTRTQMQNLAVAKEIKVRIHGRNGLVERDFNETNFDRFRSFVTLHAL